MIKSFVLGVIILFAQYGLADGRDSAAQGLLIAIRSTTSNAKKIEIIDDGIAQSYYLYQNASSLSELTGARSLACTKEPLACLAIENWRGSLCVNNSLDLKDFWSQLWTSVFAAAKTDEQRLGLWKKIKACSTKPSAGQLYATILYLESLEDHGLTAPMTEVKEWLMLKRNAPGSPNDLIPFWVGHVQSLQNVRSKYPVARQIIFALLEQWVGSSQASQLDARTKALWLNEFIKELSRSGETKKVNSLIKENADFINNNRTLVNRYFISREYCNLSREEGNFDDCQNFITRVYAGQLDFEAQLELDRNLMEQGKFEEARKGFILLKPNLKQHSGWAPWLQFFIGTCDVYLKDYTSADRLIADHLEQLKPTSPTDSVAAGILKIKSWRMQNKFNEALTEYEVMRKKLGGIALNSPQVLAEVDYEGILIYVGMKDREQVKMAMSRLKPRAKVLNDHIHQGGLALVEKWLAGLLTQKDLEDLGRKTGNMRPAFLDLTHVLQAPTPVSK